MKSIRLSLCALLVIAVVKMTRPLAAQTFTTLHSFTRSTSPTNSDGGSPFSGLICSNGILYGTTMSGGTSSSGTVFKMNVDGSGYTNLYSLKGNTGGRNPQCGLILDGNTLYGTAYSGEFVFPRSVGKVFRINIDGSGFTNILTFTNTGGGNPAAGLVLLGNTLYGTTEVGGMFGNGEVFKVNTNGSGFALLHSFTALVNSNNTDGAFANGGLLWSGTALFGTTEKGGEFGKGTIYRINTDGTGFTNLYSFDGEDGGAAPFAGMIMSGNTLYGTSSGQNTSSGSIFRINIDGSGFTNIYNFAGSGAAAPWNSLLLLGDTLYGTTTAGGDFGKGTVFSLKTNGTDFSRLYSFTSVSNSINSDGISPFCYLIWTDEKLFGTASSGGAFGFGTVFSLTLPPPRLVMSPSAGELIFAWPTNVSGFTLQSTSDLLPPVVWETDLPAPTIIDGQNIVTNLISGTQRFYRLSQ